MWGSNCSTVYNARHGGAPAIRNHRDIRATGARIVAASVVDDQDRTTTRSPASASLFC
jgi:hypothetical protein